MASLPAFDAFTNPAQTNGPAKQAQDDMVAFISNLLGGATRSELTIATGSVTPGVNSHGGSFTIDTEADAASDDLDNIVTTNVHDGELIIVSAQDAARVVTCRHAQGGDGQMSMVDASSFVLDSLSKWIMFRNDSGTMTEVMRFYGTDDAGFKTFRSITDVVSASDTVEGIVELATTAEIDTGTDTTRAITPDALAGSFAGTKSVVFNVVAPDATLTTGNDKVALVVPDALGGMDLVSVFASHVVAGGGAAGDTTIMIRNATSAADMLSTIMTIDQGEVDTSTAAVPAVINTAEDDVATNDKLRIDIDAASSDALGLTVVLEFRLP
jgi:hypothetical protein